MLKIGLLDGAIVAMRQCQRGAQMIVECADCGTWPAWRKMERDLGGW